MLGFLIGTACLIGLVKTIRWGRGGCGYGGYGHHGWGRRGWGGHGPFGDHYGHEGFGGGWGGGRQGVFLRMLFQRLDTTPGQEKVIAAAVEEMREAAYKARGELATSRADLAKALRSPAVDEVLFGEMFARHDTAIEAVRKASVGAIAKVHDALDERQRARLADMIESGFFRSGFGGGWGRERYHV